jgi:hypothetical protein
MLPGELLFGHSDHFCQEDTMLQDVRELKRTREQVRTKVQDQNGFDYNASAELFPSRGKKNSGSLTYKRFPTTAEALRFAVEELPPRGLIGAYLEVDEVRYGFQEMRSLYENAAYPLKRRTTTRSSAPLRDGAQGVPTEHGS